MKFYSLFVLLLLSQFAYNSQAQSKWTVSKFPNQDSIISSLHQTYTVQQETYPNPKALKLSYKQRLEYLELLFNNSSVLYNDSLYKYINSVFEHIIDSNSQLKSTNFRFYVSNSPFPNASSLGEGSFIINVGLLRKLANESQLAFILCHEIAHLYLDHSNKKVILDYNKENSKVYKKKIKSIAKQEYKRLESLKKLLKEGIYKDMAHSRAYELEADSLGFFFFENTSYSTDESKGVLQLFDTIDVYKYNHKIDYQRLIGSTEYPFKKRWLTMENSLFGGYVEENYWDNDSIKSHPDCQTRIEALVKIIPTKINVNQQSKKFIQDSLSFFHFKQQADHEFIESWIQMRNYGRALFYTLKHLQVDQSNIRLNIKLSRLLKLIYQAQLDHKLGLYVQRPSTKNEPEYDELLVFFDNIRLSELANLCNAYHQTRLDQFGLNEIFFKNAVFFNKL